MNKLIHQRDVTFEGTVIELCAKAAIKKLEWYFEESHKSFDIYAAATLMNPAYRDSYFIKHWKSTDAGKARYDKMFEQVNDTWTTNYAPVNVDLPAQRKVIQVVDDFITEDINPVSNGGQVLADYVATRPTRFYNTISTSVTTVSKPTTTDEYLEWWLKNGDPALISFAIDLLAIPMSSAFIERFWSVAGYVSQARMGSMHDITIEQRVMLLYNIRAGVHVVNRE